MLNCDFQWRFQWRQTCLRAPRSTGKLGKRRPLLAYSNFSFRPLGYRNNQSRKDIPFNCICERRNIRLLLRSFAFKSNDSRNRLALKKHSQKHGGVFVCHTCLRLTLPEKKELRTAGVSFFLCWWLWSWSSASFPPP